MEIDKIKVGYFCLQNPENKRVWSGTHYSLTKAIENAGFEIVNISPIVFPRLYHRLLMVYNTIHRFFSKKLIQEEFTFLSAFFSRRYLKKKIKYSEVDILFSPASSAQISLLNTKIPIIFFNDTSLDQIKDYYPNYKSFSTFSIYEASILQRLAFRKSKKIIFPSKWAFDYASNYYKISESKLKETKLGANLPTPEKFSNKEFNNGFNFIFSGVSWERKGGDLVIDTIDKLIKKGHKVNLYCMGVKPPVEREYLKYLGFLDKNKEDDVKLMLEIYLKSHFMFVPSLEECYGIVFSEASAYGMINVSRNTGGISSVVKQGINGFLFDKEAAVDDYVNFFEKLFSNSNEMNSMFLKSYNYYQENLNWYVFSQTFLECYNEIILKKK